MHAQAIAGILKDYGVAASPALCGSISLYIDVLLKWNQKVNLISITDPKDLVGRHFGESLFAVNAVPLQPRSLVDVGSGAGFPGLALKLVLPETKVTLIEASTKKAAFLSEVVRRLNVKPVTVVRARAEDVDPTNLGAECITARAVGHFDDLLEWSRRALAPSGRIILWLGADDAVEVTNAHAWAWSQPIPIPKSVRRVILAGGLR